MSELRVNNVSEVGGDPVIAAGVLDSGSLPAGSIVAVKSALKTDTFTASVNGGDNVAVTDLSITHALSDASNKLVITGYFGVFGDSGGTRGGVGVAVDGTLIGVGDAAGSRTRLASGGVQTASSGSFVVGNRPTTFVYAPGDTSSHTYTLRAINMETSTLTLYINRSALDDDTAGNPRGSSSLIIQEVAV